MRILLVEDELAIAKVLRRGLEELRYQVDVAHDGLTGLEMARRTGYGLIVLDLMLPKLDGIRVCEALRSERNATPILMLTARDTVEDRVKGLDCGADDYLPKPFDFTELRARVQALLRRDKVHRVRRIQIGDLVIDCTAGTVSRGGKEIHLTRREYTLLEALAANEGRILTREAILDRVWMDEESMSNTVDVHIGVLRKKIDAGQPVRLIHTVHGLGYTLRRPDHPPGSRGSQE
jgi:two-component system copper resistance phosphate regulon response regulator CusR